MIEAMSFKDICNISDTFSKISPVSSQYRQYEMSQKII